MIIGLALTSWNGCASSGQQVGKPIEQIWEAPVNREPPPPPVVAATSQLSVTPANSQTADILAVVNRQPILRSDITQLLYECHGINALEQLVLLQAARQRAAELSLTITKADIAAAHQEALRRLAAPLAGSNSAPLDNRTAQALLDQFLVAKNISRREWDLRMEQRAYLAKIAAAEVARMEVTDTMLREEYSRSYGEKVQIRHIQMASLAAVSRVKAMLAAGKEFELVARQQSENELSAANGGLLPPFTRNDPAVPPLLRETAFGMKVGQISSAIHEQDRYHLIKVERTFPASLTPFELVDKKVLRQSLTDRLVRQRQEALEGELFNSAAVDIRDDTMRTAFQQKHRKTK